MKLKPKYLFLIAVIFVFCAMIFWPWISLRLMGGTILAVVLAVVGMLISAVIYFVLCAPWVQER